MSLFSRVVIAATHNPLARKVVTGTRPGQALARRFVAGDSLEAGIEAVRVINGEGMTVSLDLLGEEVFDRETAVNARDAYLACLDAISREGLDANISIKLTQLGLAFDQGFASDAVDRLATKAASAGNTVTIDMEGSAFTAATVDIYAAHQPRHGNLGIALQAYLHRTPEDLERLAPLGGHIRLCKGAYVEPPEVAIQSKAEINTAFARLLEVLMREEGVIPAIATHDDQLIALTIDLARSRRAPFEFQMLYGVRVPLQRSLREDGYPMRVYVPYGSEWYAYLTRRLAERPANLMFFARALTGRAGRGGGGR